MIYREHRMVLYTSEYTLLELTFAGWHLWVCVNYVINNQMYKNVHSYPGYWVAMLDDEFPTPTIKQPPPHAPRIAGD